MLFRAARRFFVHREHRWGGHIYMVSGDEF
jgi:hypothetical protein